MPPSQRSSNEALTAEFTGTIWESGRARWVPGVADQVALARDALSPGSTEQVHLKSGPAQDGLESRFGDSVEVNRREICIPLHPTRIRIPVRGRKQRDPRRVEPPIDVGDKGQRIRNMLNGLKSDDGAEPDSSTTPELASSVENQGTNLRFASARATSERSIPSATYPDPFSA
jgi:hypothetical protein